MGEIKVLNGTKGVELYVTARTYRPVLERPLI